MKYICTQNGEKFAYKDTIPRGVELMEALRHSRFVHIALIGVLAWVAFHALEAVLGNVLQDWEMRATDSRFRLRGKIPTSSDIVHIDIDDTSIETVGNWPWKRGRHGDLIHALSEAGASVVAFDVLFLHPGDPKDDLALEEALSAYKRVVLPVAFELAEGEGPSPLLENAPSTIQLLAPFAYPRAPHQGVIQTSRSALPVHAFLRAAQGTGHISATPDPDGVFRRTALLLSVGGLIIPSFDLEVLRLHLGRPREAVYWMGSNLVVEGDPMIKIPLDAQARLWINYAGTWGEGFRHVSCAEVFEALDDPQRLRQLRELLQDKICLVGFTATGVTDIGPIPLERDFPLVGIHSHILNTILRGQYLRPTSPWVREVLSLFMIGVTGLLCVVLHPLLALAAVGTLVGSYLAFSQLLFVQAGRILPILVPGIPVLLAFMGIQVYLLRQEAKKRHQVQMAFERYVSPQMLGRLLENPLQSQLGGYRKELSILFSDIVGFTSLSDTLEPEEVLALLNEYFEEMTRIVFEHGGTVDKFLGDGLMAFFGDPVDLPDHALRAVRAGLDMQKAMVRLREEWTREGRTPFQIRIGINTGFVTVGNMGSSRRMDYTVIGNDVNLAQRLESIAEPGTIVISNRSYSLVKDVIQTVPLGARPVKGKRDPIQVYQVVQPDNQGPPSEEQA